MNTHTSWWRRRLLYLEPEELGAYILIGETLRPIQEAKTNFNGEKDFISTHPIMHNHEKVLNADQI